MISTFTYAVGYIFGMVLLVLGMVNDPDLSFAVTAFLSFIWAEITLLTQNLKEKK